MQPQDKITELMNIIQERDEHEADYQRIIKEILKCDPIPACKRPDDQLEPPWEVVKRMREKIADLEAKYKLAISDYEQKWGQVMRQEEEIERLKDRLEVAEGDCEVKDEEVEMEAGSPVEELP